MMRIHSHDIAREIRARLWQEFQNTFKVVQDGSLREWALGLTSTELPALLVKLENTSVEYTGKVTALVTETFHLDILQSVENMTNPEADKRTLVLQVVNFLVSQDIVPNLTEFQFRSQRVVSIDWELSEAADLIDLTKVAVVRVVVEYAYYTP